MRGDFDVCLKERNMHFGSLDESAKLRCVHCTSGKLQGVWLRDLVIYILLLWNFWALSYFK
jgi:hypothetical protein